MIELLKQKISLLKSRSEKYNITREFLQSLTLKILSDAQAFRSIAFIGGTALRILYRVRRYSEDLDFSLWSKTNYDFELLTASLVKEFALMNIDVELKTKRGVVDSCMINFVSVLQDLGISVARDQTLSVKLEVDTNPPLGAAAIETVVNADFLFPVRHYDLPSLMAGKLHAILCRKYTKGRDYYDLLWYLSRKTAPNIKLLENAIFQTEKKDFNLAETGWIKFVSKKLSDTDFHKVRKDVAPFIEDPNEIELLTEPRFQQLLTAYSI